MSAENDPLIDNPTMDVGQVLAELIGDTGVIQEFSGGYRVKIYHLRAFPWDEVFKTLLFRDFKVYVTRQKADIFIEATP